MSFHIPAEPIRFQCRHILTDGRRCKNPTLRSPRTEENPGGHENFCYFHHTTRRPIQKPSARRSRRSAVTLPAPCDLTERTGIQLAIAEVLHRIASNDIDPRRAGLLLYGLQIASLNLKKHRQTEPVSASSNEHSAHSTTVAEITHDPTLGALAPPAELGSNEPKGSAQLLLEELSRIDEDDQQQPTTIQAVADSITEPNLTTPISRICAKTPGREGAHSAQTTEPNLSDRRHPDLSNQRHPGWPIHAQFHRA